MRTALLLLATTTGCAPSADVQLSDDSPFGYVQASISVDSAKVDPSAVEFATAGGHSLLDVHVVDGVIVGMVQGHFEGGDQDLVLVVDGVEHVFADAVHYRESNATIGRVVIMGASVAYGVQSGVPSDRGSLHSIAPHIGRAFDVSIPLPLLAPDLLQPITAADMGPAPDCDSPDSGGWVAAAAVASLQKLVGSDGTTDMRLSRQDPDLVTQVLAVPSMGVRDLVVPPDGFAKRFISHMVFAPHGLPGDPVSSQLEMVVNAQADLVLAPDVMGNDVIDAVYDELDASEVSDPELVRDDLRALIAGLANTGAQVYVGDAPNPLALPLAIDARRRMREAGRSEQQIADEAAAIESAVTALNEALYEEVAKFDNVHIFPLHDTVNAIHAQGLMVDGQALTTHKGGGLISLDSLHFSDTGYAEMAARIVEQVSTDLGVEIVQPVDLERAMASDPFQPASLQAAGWDPTSCAN